MSSVTSEEVARVGREVGLDEPLVIPEHRSSHSGPGFLDAERPCDVIALDLLTLN